MRWPLVCATGLPSRPRDFGRGALFLPRLLFGQKSPGAHSSWCIQLPQQVVMHISCAPTSGIAQRSNEVRARENIYVQSSHSNHVIRLVGDNRRSLKLLLRKLGLGTLGMRFHAVAYPTEIWYRRSVDPNRDSSRVLRGLHPCRKTNLNLSRNN